MPGRAPTGARPLNRMGATSCSTLSRPSTEKIREMATFRSSGLFPRGLDRDTEPEPKHRGRFLSNKDPLRAKTLVPHRLLCTPHSPPPRGPPPHPYAPTPFLSSTIAPPNTAH